MSKAKRIAIIGAGPAGAISIDALAQEQAFDIIRVFERRERPGGCWMFDQTPPPPLSDFENLAKRTADAPLAIPRALPAQVRPQKVSRYDDTPVYPLLETNIDAAVMEFSQEPIPARRSDYSISLHGNDTPFRSHQVIRQYVEDLVNRNGYQDFVEYNTTVELVEKEGEEWRLVLRKGGEKLDYWWEERFDAVVVANGHFSVPYLPLIRGLKEFAELRPGSVDNSKAYRGREKYRGKRVIVVGASVSGDAAVDVLGIAQSPVFAAVKGHNPNLYFGDAAFDHPGITKVPSISRIDPRTRSVFFEDGTLVENVDNIILATGYSWSLPFLPGIPIRNNRVPDLYLHIFHQSDPTLVFIGAVAAGLTFKVYEWQSVPAARVLAGRAKLPPIGEQKAWEAERIQKKGDGVAFTALWPTFEEYFETVRALAGEPGQGIPGRRLPRFDPDWVRIFIEGHQRRIEMWEKANSEARQRREKAATKLARL
ncbi:hypothetical protein INS49_007396 [Diaporthe citri]|uniref:uncharacterized protein n=1 Tax=Diaporthe citri TaxID=83186 RepID=UPI001C81242A|nr:uncharacterized protein INS49_007396 [Diaporthe citri]KAG6365785.1 hypothetical protein INS49_007396 [Diaporthe citri]